MEAWVMKGDSPRGGGDREECTEGSAGRQDLREAGVREEGEKDCGWSSRCAVRQRDDSQPAWAGASEQTLMDSNLGKLIPTYGVCQSHRTRRLMIGGM
ncbi:hypothetical protein AAFF_G00426840 [Aldrovandia affinis]|uniref:Uncharacterized protein n=1 Tax=Aldrovandia affinis TaxID=143900 RepID=A0AAD7WJL5_9TELE|nr:hypothetical protein AAFF_G00426840 [Aldrovandia affinis]